MIWVDSPWRLANDPQDGDWGTRGRSFEQADRPHGKCYARYSDAKRPPGGSQGDVRFVAGLHPSGTLCPGCDTVRSRGHRDTPRCGFVRPSPFSVHV